MAAKTSSLTLTRFATDAGHGLGGSTLEEARESFRRLGLKDYATSIHEIVSTFEAGDAVEVRAFGRVRPGTVIGLGKTKVKVQHARNASGVQDQERSFSATEVFASEANSVVTVHAPVAEVVTEEAPEAEVVVDEAPEAEVVAEEAPEAPAAPVNGNREEWLLEAVTALRPVFLEQDAEVPALRVSVGWPGGRGKKSATIGQCWSTGSASDKVSQVFISPVLEDAGQVLATLVHEMIHAWDDCKSAHRGAFARMAGKVGLEGPMTATHAGADLAARLEEIAEGLGAYPHAALSASSAPKKQTTRMLKVACPEDGYTIRTTAKWLEVGLPVCPCGTEMMQEA